MNEYYADDEWMNECFLMLTFYENNDERWLSFFFKIHYLVVEYHCK